MLARLSGGMRVVIRPIRPTDKAKIAATLTQLSADTVYKRFLAPKQRFSTSELRYLTEVDGVDHFAVIAVLYENPEHVAAVGRYVRLASDPTTAETAIVVGDPYQAQGLGRRLGILLADRARACGIRRFSALMLSDNVPAHRLFATMSEHVSNTCLASGVDEMLVEFAA